MSVTVSFEVLEYLSYAMAHNGIPVMSKVRLTNEGPELEAVSVHVEVRDSNGLVSMPCVVRADLAAGQGVVLGEVGLRLDPEAMFQVTDQQPARVIVRVEHEGDEVGAAAKITTLLPGNHWRSQPAGLGFELLAAFVMPNDPAIRALLDDVTRRLGEATGSPSLEGYQSGPGRADAIAKAVWEATQARAIRYAEPPASWGAEGQKVRTPTAVLEHRLGTCLDTTVVMAAALEQAGIRPLIWVIEGHAFLAYWREEAALDAIAYGDGADVVNEVDRGRMRLIETTAVTQSEHPTSFEDAHRLAAHHLRDLSKVLAVIDVWVARTQQIFPLPVRRTSSDGAVQVFEYQPSAERDVTLIFQRPEDTEEPAVGRATAPPRVQQWKNGLLDLTLRNRLINYTSRAGVSITVPEDRLGLVENIISAGRPLHLRPGDAVAAVQQARGADNAADLDRNQLESQLVEKSALFTDVTTSAYQTRMRGIAYRARTIVEETGANNLYLALGSLHWRIDNRPLRSPLVLVPVRLVAAARGGSYRLELDETGASTPNYCLLEKLRQVDGVSIPGLENPVLDDSGIDLDAALGSVRDVIASKGLPYRVEPTADLSILQFAKFRLWKDLDEHWEALTRNRLVAHLVRTPTDPFVDPVAEPEDLDLDALDASCPVAADASQLSAVAEAVHGRTFVLEGPPGTGKSQTITNLLTRAIADGKRVLFVAEKRAALDVVQSRLESVGMGDFSLDLHDRGSKPAIVRSQIRAAMDHVAVVDEQGLAASTSDLSQASRSLVRYAERLHEPNGRGLSYYSARTQLLTLGADGPAFSVPPQLLTTSASTKVAELLLAADRVGDASDPARPSPEHPWAFVRCAPPPDGDVVRSLADAARQVDLALGSLADAGLRKVLESAVDTSQLMKAAELAPQAAVDIGTLDEARGPAWRATSRALTSEIGALVAAAHPGLDVATPSALDLPLADIHAAAQQAATSSFFGRRKRLKAVLAKLEPVLRPGAEVKPKAVPDLTAALLQVQGAVRGLATQSQAIRGLAVPPTWNPFSEEGNSLVARQVDWLIRVSDALPSADRSDDFALSLRAWMGGGPQVDQVDIDAARSLADGFVTLLRLAETTDTVLDTWRAGHPLVPRWQATSDRRGLEESTPLSLTRWLALNTAVGPFEEAGLVEAADALRTGSVEGGEARQALERGVAIASIMERERATGLDTFDHQGHQKVIERFLRSASKVRDEQVNTNPAAVVAARDFDPTSAFGQVGELQRELGKQRRALGVRALMEKYGDLITQLMPCVLVSPDSVARFFPVGTVRFDMVVFDEASQIRVADAIGAMGRSSSVVIVGDSKQMPPTTFGESSFSDDADSSEEGPVIEDGESILKEALAARVAQRWLSWHYRSQDESLIAFSNLKYYDGRLSSFPAPTSASADRLASGRGVSLVRIDGKFRRSDKGKLLRTNPEEAAAILSDLERRFAASPDAVPSIGVITFNLQQRTYLESLIRDSGNERLVQALDEREGEGLFVKNLENVQGDERDVILFSLAFSANDKGIVPLNFGPLTRQGGERRLNVAVTRARRQVVLYSSFDPGQLRVEQTQSQGVKDLQSYLLLAAHGPGEWAAASPAVRARQDRHRDDIAAALQTRGISVQSDVGLSDFRIDLSLASAADPDTPKVAVLLDGPDWAKRRTVNDRDGLPRQVLRDMMRWPAVERVWMPEWVDHRDEVVERLVSAVETAVAVPDDVGASAASSSPWRAEDDVPPPARHEVDETPGATDVEAMTSAADLHTMTAPPTPARRDLPGQETFQAFVPRLRGPRSVLDDLPSARAAAQVRSVITDATATEGPVHRDRLARLVASSFDLSRVNEARTRSILGVLPPECVLDAAGFVWPRDPGPDGWAVFRTSPSGERPVDHISVREIGNAMAALCRAAAGMSPDELDSAALALFGGKRRTAGIATRLAAARSDALSQGRLVADANGFLRVAD